MNKILYLILFSILGILLYQILSNICECKLTEGYGLFGRVNLDKCCPRGYKYSKTMKECVAICDNCGPSVYNKLTLKKVVRQNQEVLEASFDCDEHDASTVYDYDSINRRYTKDDLRYNKHREGWDMNSDFFTASVPSVSGVEDSTDGVQAAEEGGNETWSGISTDASTAMGATDTADIETSIYPFQGLPVETYYTNQDDCNTDYDRAESENMNVSKPDGSCIGHWKLDFENPIITYLKDNENKIFTAPFVIDGTAPSELNQTLQEYHQNYVDRINTIISEMDEDAPVRQYYSIFLNEVDEDDEEELENEIEITNINLNRHRSSFCTQLGVNINSGIFNTDEQDNTDLIKDNNTINGFSYNQLCEYEGDLTDINISNNWDNFCASDNLTIPDDSPFNLQLDGEPVSELCKYEHNGLINDDNHRYLCPNSSGLDIEPNKTFCST